MRLIHSECGGPLVIDWSTPRELVDNGRTTDIYTPIKCESCNMKLGMLPNVDEAPERAFVLDTTTRREHAN